MATLNEQILGLLTHPVAVSGMVLPYTFTPTKKLNFGEHESDMLLGTVEYNNPVIDICLGMGVKVDDWLFCLERNKLQGHSEDQWYLGAFYNNSHCTFCSITFPRVPGAPEHFLLCMAILQPLAKIIMPIKIPDMDLKQGMALWMKDA